MFKLGSPAKPKRFRRVIKTDLHNAYNMYVMTVIYVCLEN